MAVEYKTTWRNAPRDTEEAVKAFVESANGREYYYLPFRGLLVRYDIAEGKWEAAYFIEKVEGVV